LFILDYRKAKSCIAKLLCKKGNPMSDKFFFKGRQESRQNHVNAGYKTRGSHKLGSKKFPLTLVVDSDERAQVVAAQVQAAGLFADLSIDSEAPESIVELTALLSKGDTVKSDKTPSRNDPCHCDSGKKYKKCCG
jgi:SWIM/SEC-C metal-binding protein